MKTIFTKKYNVFFLLLTIVVLVSAVSLHAFAAATGTHTPIAGVTVGVSGATDNSMTGGAVTVTAKGSGGFLGIGASAKTATITVSNGSGAIATLAFDWTATSVNQLKIDGNVHSGTSGNFSKMLGSGESFTITITTAKNSTVNKLVMSNFSLEEAATASDVTFEYDSTLGSITAGGVAVESGTTQEVSLTDGVTLTATTKTGVSFLGWIDQSSKILSTNANFKLTTAEDITVRAVFAEEGGKPWFAVGDATQKSEASGLLNLGKRNYHTIESISYLFEDLNDAASFSKDSSSKYLVLMNSGVLPSGVYTVPSGVTLLIPFDTANTLFTTEALSSSSTYTNPTAYRTLTLAEGASITVNGAMSISGKHQQTNGGSANGSAPTGKVGFVKMQSGSTITVANGGKLYAYGYIVGSGSVNAQSGAIVYELFQLADFRGGTQSTDMKNRVFPLSQYYLQNIEVPTTVYSGAKVYGYTTVSMSNYKFGSGVSFIGTNDGMFRLTSGYIVKRYDGKSDRLVVDIYGDMTIANLKIPVSSTSVDSKDYVLPINGNITVNIHSGTTTLNQDMALIPGSVVAIDEGAKFQLGSGKSLYVYDYDDWGSYCRPTPTIFQPIVYAPGKEYTRTVADLHDAKLVIDGTLDAASGYLYTTAGGGNICSTGAGVVNLQTVGETVTYQYNGDSPVSISVTLAQLMNGDGSYTITAPLTSSPSTYNYVDGMWILEQKVCEHTNREVTPASAATCSSTGLTEGEKCSDCGLVIIEQQETPMLAHQGGTYLGYTEPTCEIPGGYLYDKCSACGSEYSDPVPALGHDYSSVVTEPTCTENGYTTHVCTRCDDTYIDNSVDALGHTEAIDAAVDATCTESGLTEGSHCSVCGEILVAQSEVSALGHSAVTDAAVVPTCTETGLTEGSHCSVCGEILVAQNEVPALGHSYDFVVTEPTCTEAGYTTHTCSTCGDSYVADQVNALGHRYESVTIDPTCTEAGYTTYTCACGESYISDEVAATGHSYGGWVVDGDTKTSTCGGCGEIAKRLVGEMNHLYSVQDVLYYNGSFDYSKDAKEIVFKDPQGNVLDTILCVQDSSGVIYLTYAMPSNVILDVVEFVIWIDGVQTDVFEINFDSYADTQTGTNYEKVAQAIVDYGNASSTYFGKNEISEITAKYTSEPESGMSIKSNATESTSLDTYGASFVFDEYIAIKIYLSGNYTFKDGYTYQVGVLFGDETTSELNVNSIGNLCNAYVLYNTLEDVEISASDWVSPISAASADISKVPVLADKPGVQINLESVEYSKRFAIRAYLIECNADGNQTVYYGRQVNYGLEDYVCSMYNRTDEVLKTSYKVDNPKAFKQFLIETWNYAVAAKETKWAE